MTKPKSESQHIKGTIAARVEGELIVTSPLKVLRRYMFWGDTPQHWSDNRAAELAVAISWALHNIPADIKMRQENEEVYFGLSENLENGERSNGIT